MQNASNFAVGDRIRLVEMWDPYRDDIPIGIEGTVTGTVPPPMNMLNVDWDGDFNLNPCLDVDRVAKVSD